MGEFDFDTIAWDGAFRVAEVIQEREHLYLLQMCEEQKRYARIQRVVEDVAQRQLLALMQTD